MRLFRGVHPVDHYPFEADPDDTQPDAHGNLPGAVADTPIARKAIAIYPKGSTEPVTPDYAARVVTSLAMLVEDPTPYGHRDEVEIGGTRYEVDGLPDDWRQGPFPKFTQIFGAAIQLRRVG